MESREEKERKFIASASIVHGGRYRYSEVKYTNSKEKVCITCPIHGEFWQTPHNHLQGAKCPQCAVAERADKRKKDFSEVIDAFNAKHGGKYDYSKVEYNGRKAKVCIICPTHGEFWQTAESHMDGLGCPKCGKRFMDKDYFIEQAQKIHGHRYDYSKVEYGKTNADKVIIVCPIHGEFNQTPKSHLRGAGCPFCSGNRQLTTEEFIKKAKKVHGDKYDYSNAKYYRNNKKVCIICPEHGEFLQMPYSHLNGRGCPQCKESHLERKMKDILTSMDIDFEYQYRDKEKFGKQSLDFYICKYNIAIECQGEQHFCSNFFKSKGIEYAEEHLRYVQELDRRKKETCKNNGIMLFYFVERKFRKSMDKEDLAFSNREELEKLIQKYGTADKKEYSAAE